MDLPSKNYLIFFKKTREKNEFHTTEIRSSFHYTNSNQATASTMFGVLVGLIILAQFLV